MKHLYSIITLLFSFVLVLPAREIRITETASLDQVYGETIESKSLLSFNELDIEFGYVLYSTEIEVKSEEAVLELENVRDYAVVYLDNELQGTVSDNNKTLTLRVSPGKYTLRLYAENIGRITYGPEILDNSKGLFGRLTLDEEEIENRIIIPLNIKECDVKNLLFDVGNKGRLPSFYKGYFQLESIQNTYLDTPGWGMGEVWINGKYAGSYWEEEKQQSIQVPGEILLKGKNEIVIFELKNNAQRTLKLSDQPVFK